MLLHVDKKRFPQKGPVPRLDPWSESGGPYFVLRERQGVVGISNGLNTLTMIASFRCALLYVFFIPSLRSLHTNITASCIYQVFGCLPRSPPSPRFGRKVGGIFDIGDRETHEFILPALDLFVQNASSYS